MPDPNQASEELLWAWSEFVSRSAETSFAVLLKPRYDGLPTSATLRNYQGDLGRTVPLSGHYDNDERETWNIFVAAYHAGATALRDGITVDEVFDAWQAELLRHRSSAKSLLAQHAIDLWSDRKNVPYWQVHTTNLTAGLPVGPLREGTTINFEPIASIDGQGYFLEDMYHITKDGAELLTPGVPYSADEIEKAMH